MTRDGSSTVALLEILGFVGQRLHRSTLSVDLALETEYVFEFGAAMRWPRYFGTSAAPASSSDVGRRVPAFGREREDFEAILRHADAVFELRRKRAVAGDRGPAVT